MTPTQLSLAHLRKQGYLCAIVERWNPHAKIRQDLYGFVDIEAVQPGKPTLYVQTTVREKVEDRKRKILAHQNFEKVANAFDSPVLRSPYRRVVIHGWSLMGKRGKRKKWTLYEEEL